MTKEQLNFYGALHPPDHCTHLITAPTLALHLVSIGFMWTGMLEEEG